MPNPPTSFCSSDRICRSRLRSTATRDPHAQRGQVRSEPRACKALAPRKTRVCVQRQWQLMKLMNIPGQFRTAFICCSHAMRVSFCCCTSTLLHAWRESNDTTSTSLRLPQRGTRLLACMVVWKFKFKRLDVRSIIPSFRIRYLLDVVHFTYFQPRSRDVLDTGSSCFGDFAARISKKLYLNLRTFF